MKIAIGCDHAGFPLKQTVVQTVKSLGHEIIDCGTCSCQRVDFPDFAFDVTRRVAAKEAARGILICGSGVGMCIAANKVKGIYACVCHDSYSAHQAVEHDNLNVLCLGARIIGPAVAEEVVTQFLNGSFLTGTRHEERFNKIKETENKLFK